MFIRLINMILRISGSNAMAESADRIADVVQKSIDILLTSMKNNVDLEQLKAASKYLEQLRLYAMELDKNEYTPLREVVYGMIESAVIAMNWIAQREIDRSEKRAVKQEFETSDEGNVKQEEDEVQTALTTRLHNKLPRVSYVNQEDNDDESANSDDDSVVSRGAWSDDEDSEDSEGEEIKDDGDSENSKAKKQRNSKSTDHKCDVCEKTFTTAGTLRVHKLTHMSDDKAKRPYACDQCDKRFTQAGSLSVHKRSHLAENDPRLRKFQRVWTCEVCTKEFRHRSGLFSHRKTHLGEDNPLEAELKRPYKCSHCGRGFSTSSTMKKHERLHTGNYKFNCEMCSRGFSDKNLFTTHMENHAKGTVRVWSGEYKNCRRWCCTLCPRKFKRDFELAAHMKRHADDTVGFSSDEEEVQNKTFSCKKCAKTYDTIQSLWQHELMSHEQPFPCSLCAKQFKLAHNLAHHMRSEHGDSENAERREKTPRPFKCTHCPCRFVSQFALDKHSPSSFKCAKCSQEFVSFALLDAHKKAVHDSTPYECSHCGKKYKELNELMEHKNLSKMMRKAGYPQGCATKEGDVRLMEARTYSMNTSSVRDVNGGSSENAIEID